jgi:hypothetical protein
VEDLPADLGGLEAALLSGTGSTSRCGLIRLSVISPVSSPTRTDLEIVILDGKFCPVRSVPIHTIDS